MPVTALLAALLTPIFVVLSARVMMLRRASGTSLGDGGDPAMLQRMRAHANFVEYAPFGLILLGLAESLQGASLRLYVLGFLLLAGRLAHAIGVSSEPQRLGLRVAGMVLTLVMIIATALTCLVAALQAI